MAEPTDFFTTGSLMTFGGATLATFIVPNALQLAFQFNPRWLGLVVAELLCITIAATGHAPDDTGGAIQYVVAVVNGCLVYCSALGATSIGAASTGQGGGRNLAAVEKQVPPAQSPSTVSPGSAEARPGVPIPKGKVAASPLPAKAPRGGSRSFFTPWF